MPTFENVSAIASEFASALKLDLVVELAKAREALRLVQLAAATATDTEQFGAQVERLLPAIETIAGPLAAKLETGAQTVSIRGEWDDPGDGSVRETGPNAIGTVLYSSDGHYCVAFENGTSVLITPEEIADPAQYRILSLGGKEL